jgi:hypothetical protein
MTLFYRPFAAIENPLVINSPSLTLPSFSTLLVKRLFRLSFPAPIFLRLAFCASSSRTRAVREAVAAFFMPEGTGVDVPLRGGGGCGVEVLERGIGSALRLRGRWEEVSCRWVVPFVWL